MAVFKNRTISYAKKMKESPKYRDQLPPPGDLKTKLADQRWCKLVHEIAIKVVQKRNKDKTIIAKKRRKLKRKRGITYSLPPLEFWYTFVAISDVKNASKFKSITSIVPQKRKSNDTTQHTDNSSIASSASNTRLQAKNNYILTTKKRRSL